MIVTARAATPPPARAIHTHVGVFGGGGGAAFFFLPPPKNELNNFPAVGIRGASASKGGKPIV
jgi:hypothetical protein